MKSSLGSGSFVFQIVPGQPVPPNDKVGPNDLIEKKIHDKSAALLTQVAQLFVGATTMFSALAKQAAEASSRIAQLQGRIDNLRVQVPHVEQLCASGQDFSRNQRSGYKSDRTEKSQLFVAGTVADSVLKRHLANPPAPDLAPLDRFRSDGKPCLMFYTYPQFFLDEWVREQEKEMAERQAKNAERRAEKAARQQHGTGTGTQANVKQVMKRVYDVDTGQLITVAAGEAGSGGIERRAPTAAAAAAPKNQTYVAQTFPPPPAGSRPPPSAAAASFPPPPPISSGAKAALRPMTMAPAPPPPGMPGPTPGPRTSPRPVVGGGGAPPPPPLFGGGGFAPAPPSPFGSAPPPPPQFYQAPQAPAFVPPPAPAGPPPPAAPPPPPPGSLAAQLEAVKAQTAAPSGGGGLLESIKAGVALKKAAPIEERPAAADFSGGFNVSAILARRAALEQSDEESNSDWD